jgi:cyclophilin family peptidyl-prolyl cis-trans isomerase
MMVLCAAMIAAGACNGGRSGTPSPGRNRLLDPVSAFWRESAPGAYRARVETSRGPFVMEVHREWAPIGADRFYNLIRAGYYDDSRFTRVVPGFIVQFGIARDSAINATWVSRSFADDTARASNTRGTFAFAMTGPNARTTQIYINLIDNAARLDSQGFAPLGRVVEGMSVVDSLYGGYGESSGGGMRAGRQGPLLNGGNAYIDREFPKLDRLVRIVIER